MRDLIATKAGRYGTRRLLPDDAFQARPRDARLLVAIGKARYAEDAKPAPKATPEPPKASSIDTLRAEYQRKTGKRPFMGWDAETLREKIAGKAD